MCFVSCCGGRQRKLAVAEIESFVLPCLLTWRGFPEPYFFFFSSLARKPAQVGFCECFGGRRGGKVEEWCILGVLCSVDVLYPGESARVVMK